MDLLDYLVLRSNIFVIMGGYESFVSKMLAKMNIEAHQLG